LELDQDRGSLQASTLFIELSNEDHPFYWDGVQNIACVCNRLGESAIAVQLYRVVLGCGRMHMPTMGWRSRSVSSAGRARAFTC